MLCFVPHVGYQHDIMFVAAVFKKMYRVADEKTTYAQHIL